MKVSELGRRTTSTPAKGVLTSEKQDKQYDEPFPKPGKYKDSQDLMGGPKYLDMLDKEQKAAYAKERIRGIIEKGTLWREGSYHQ